MLLAMPIVALMTSCEPRELTPEDVFTTDDQTSIDAQLKAENPQGYKIYTLDEFVDEFMGEEGNFHNDTTPYRERSYDATHKLYLYSIDTIKTDTIGIYIRGRITTDDYGGNFYKAMVIQQVVNGEQQNLRISVDLGSSAGMYQLGQEILIRCNGLAIGRYANQPQLCVPSYNDNIYAMSAYEKVGWAPGRIQGSVFRKATRMIGTPDITKIKYDTLTLDELYTLIPATPTVDAAGMAKIRQLDGRLVVLKDVHFTGQCYDKGLVNCVVGHPDSVSNANVFAPSTQNIGYPQSRVVANVDESKMIMCSNSEYAKFAYFYLPGATKKGVTGCKDYEGTITGILGWYLDKASELANNFKDYKKGTDDFTWTKWSVTPRGIVGPNNKPNFGAPDIKMYYQGDPTDPWVPKEYDPNDK